MPLIVTETLDYGPQDVVDDSDLQLDFSESKRLIPAQTPPSKLSSISSGSIQHDDREYIEVRLNNEQYLTAIGEYDLEATQGLATVYGLVLRKQSGRHRVSAPTTHALPQIVARQQNTILRLTSIQPSLLKLQNISPLFRNLWADDVHQRSFNLLDSTEDDRLKRSLGALEIDQATQNCLNRLASKAEASLKPLRIMAIGAKSSGKSTFNRLLCNTLLSKPAPTAVQYLDIDPGQPEFGPPGQISLVKVTAPTLGPPFTHLATRASTSYVLRRSHAIAATSFKDDPEHYMACTKDLAQHAGATCPLIVNSCGWATGIGAKVLVDVMDALDPTDVAILEPVDVDLLQTIESRFVDTTIHRIPRRAPKPASRTPAEMRAMQSMAYFHQKPVANHRPSSWTGKPISQMRPWRLSYDGPDAAIIAIASYGQSPHPDFLAEVLDGSVVAIVTVDETVQFEDATMPASVDMRERSDAWPRLVLWTPEHLPHITASRAGFCSPLDPKHSDCQGLALVRGVDVEHNQLHLITPLPEDEVAALMSKQVILVRGSFDPPDWAYVEDLYKNKDDTEIALPDSERPWVSQRDMVGVESAVWRLRHPPMASAMLTNR